MYWVWRSKLGKQAHHSPDFRFPCLMSLDFLGMWCLRSRFNMRTGEAWERAALWEMHPTQSWPALLTWDKRVPLRLSSLSIQFAALLSPLKSSLSTAIQHPVPWLWADCVHRLLGFVIPKLDVICMCSPASVSKGICICWEEGSIGKMLTVSPCRPEFDSENPCKFVQGGNICL